MEEKKNILSRIGEKMWSYLKKKSIEKVGAENKTSEEMYEEYLVRKEERRERKREFREMRIGMYNRLDDYFFDDDDL